MFVKKEHQPKKYMIRPNNFYRSLKKFENHPKSRKNRKKPNPRARYRMNLPRLGFPTPPKEKER
jgi:hypothetical protein